MAGIDVGLPWEGRTMRLLSVLVLAIMVGCTSDEERANSLAKKFAPVSRTEQVSMLCSEDKSALSPALLAWLSEEQTPAPASNDKNDKKSAPVEVLKTEMQADGAVVTVVFTGASGKTLQDVVRVKNGPDGWCVVHGYAELAMLKAAIAEAKKLEEGKKPVEAIKALTVAMDRLEEAQLWNSDVEAKYDSAMNALANMASSYADQLQSNEYNFQKAIETLSQVITRLEKQQARLESQGRDLSGVNRWLEQFAAKLKEAKDRASRHLVGRWMWDVKDDPETQGKVYQATLYGIADPDTFNSVDGSLIVRCLRRKVEFIVDVPSEQLYFEEVEPTYLRAGGQFVFAYDAMGDRAMGSKAIGRWNRQVGPWTAPEDWQPQYLPPLSVPVLSPEGTGAKFPSRWVKKVRDMKETQLTFKFLKLYGKKEIYVKFDTTGSRVAISKVQEHC